ncbi:MAG: creatininase family protein [Armatimonadetes bacterium]|nr:creatininase family protein [Armatimonadota bacterium]
MKSTHRWEELLPEEFMAEFERAPIAYWAAGAMEEHGLHNALGTDYVQCYEVCLRTAEIVGGIVFPRVPLAPAGIPGYSREQLRLADPERLFPPSLWISREACELVYTELLESLADMGFRACLALGGHWPADLLLQGLHQRHQGRIGDMRFYGGGTVGLLGDFLTELQQADPLSGGHGTHWETSLVMAIRPEWVDLSRLPHLADSSLPSQLRANSPEVYTHIADANPGLGERILEALVESAVGKARALLT